LHLCPKAEASLIRRTRTH